MNIEAIANYIRNEILRDPEAEIAPDQDLLLSGSLDSLDVVRLVEHLETESGVEIPAQDVTLENFGSLASIDSYLTARRS